MKIILFDGVCNFCNSAVNFILKRDKESLFHFAPLQSDKGRELLMKHNRGNTGLNSLVLIDEDDIYEGINAVIGITKHLKGYKFVYHFLRVLPHSITSSLYSFVAKNRYKWFGKRDVCRVPSEEEKGRFLG